MFCNSFLLICGFSSRSLDIVFSRKQVFDFIEVQRIILFILCIAPLVLHLKSHSYDLSHLDIDLLLCYLIGVLRVLHFTFSSVIYFELIFVSGIGLCLDFFFMWMSSSSKTICWKDSLCSFVKDQLTIFVWVYFWAV